MKHIKRQSAPTNWPIERKGTTFIVTPLGSISEGVPILILLRDILNLAENRKEVKRAIKNQKVLLNHKKIKNVRNTAKLFDVVTLSVSGKSYRVSLTENGKFTAKEISEKDATYKITKVTNKTLLKDKKLQLNLYDGRNILQKTKCETGDSVLVNLKEGKIEDTLKLKKGSEVLVFAGKHSGKEGKVKDIDEKNQIVNIDTGKEKVNALIKQIIVVK